MPTNVPSRIKNEISLENKQLFPGNTSKRKQKRAEQKKGRVYQEHHTINTTKNEGAWDKRSLIAGGLVVCWLIGSLFCKKDINFKL